MKNKKLYLISAMAMLFTAGNALAADFSFTPRAGIGMMNYDFEWKNTSNQSVLYEVSDTLILGTVGATASAGIVYVDAYMQKTNEGDNDVNWPVGSMNYKYDITDLSMTLGVNVWKNLSVYAGWKDHETSFDGSGDLSAQDTFESDGFFGGLAFGLVFDPGVLSVNLAYADLNGDYQTGQTIPGWGQRSWRAQDVSANGFTVGAGWRGFIGELLSYSLQADWYKYTFDDFSTEYSQNGGAYGPATFTSEIEEEALTFRAMIAYQL